MANTLGIPERTLEQMADATNSINVIGGTDGRRSALEPLVVRATNHADNDTGETGSDTDLMAIFKSDAHGQPWEKEAGTLVKITQVGELVEAPDPQDPDVIDDINTQVSTLYPNFDYSTFE